MVFHDAKIQVDAESMLFLLLFRAMQLPVLFHVYLYFPRWELDGVFVKSAFRS